MSVISIISVFFSFFIFSTIIPLIHFYLLCNYIEHKDLLCTEIFLSIILIAIIQIVESSYEKRGVTGNELDHNFFSLSFVINMHLYLYEKHFSEKLMFTIKQFENKMKNCLQLRNAACVFINYIAKFEKDWMTDTLVIKITVMD